MGAHLGLPLIGDSDRYRVSDHIRILLAVNVKGEFINKGTIGFNLHANTRKTDSFPGFRSVISIKGNANGTSKSAEPFLGPVIHRDVMQMGPNRDFVHGFLG